MKGFLVFFGWNSLNLRSVAKGSLGLLAGMYSPSSTKGGGTVGLWMLYRPNVGICRAQLKVKLITYGLPSVICGVMVG